MAADRVDQADLERLGEHVGRYQQVIARMADSSLRIKTLAATAIGALATLAVQQQQGVLLLIAVVLTVGLALLDAYYLAIERALRGESNELVEAVVDGRAETADLFTVRQAAGGPGVMEMLTSLAAPATAIFYALIGVLLVLGWVLS